MAEVIAQSSVLLRATLHDGFPISPIEFLSANRMVITNQDMPYTEKIEADLKKDVSEFKKEIMNKIRGIKKRYLRGQFFEMARQHYKKILNPAKLRKEIAKVCE